MPTPQPREQTKTRILDYCRKTNRAKGYGGLPGDALLPALLLAALGFGLRCPGADFTVTQAGISGPGSLAAVVFEANATPGDNTIRFAITNALTPAWPLAITNNVSIQGRSDFPTIINGGYNRTILSFAAGTTSTLANLVIANGYSANGGGAIQNAGTLQVTGCIVTNNSANGYGGAISNFGNLTIRSTTIAKNITSGGLGGAVYNNGNLTIVGTTFSGNKARGGDGNSGFIEGAGGGGGGAAGGAIFNGRGVIWCTNSTFVANSVAGGRGGYGASYSGGGTPQGGDGGGIGGGIGGTGGVQGQPGSAAGGGGGGGHSKSGGTGGVLGGGRGGGYYGAYGTSAEGGDGGAGFGGGLFVESGTASLVNCTFSSNSAAGGSAGPGVIAPADGASGSGWGGGIYNRAGTVFLVNTLVGGNSVTNGSSSSPDLFGAFTSAGFNLVGNNQGASGLSVFDFQNLDAKLGPLQNNGGPTMTCVPLPGSFAIGFGSGIGSPVTDQRGVPRPQGGNCDIGAVQVVTATPLILGPGQSGTSGFSLNTAFDATTPYRIRGSTNLATWVDLTNYASGGWQRFLDSSATNFSRRFYQAVKP